MKFIVEVMDTYFANVEVEAKDESELREMMRAKKIRAINHFGGETTYGQFYKAEEENE